MNKLAIVSFYRGEQPDNEGRMIDQIWNWNPCRLESVHDYIQWLFPLQQPSQFNSHAPTLSAADIQAFQESDGLKGRLKRSLFIMLDFYGLQCQENGMEILIKPGENFGDRQINWLHSGNHNHLRLTRILTSLNLLGMKHYAKALLQCLTQLRQQYPEKISDRTYQFWQQAID